MDILKKSIVHLLSVCLIASVQALDYTALVGVVKEKKCVECANSFVTFVQDLTGNTYVVKQYKHDKWRSILATSICELVALDIGHALGVPLNTACLIPAGVEFVGKKKEMPATLHSLAPGIRFDKYLYKGKKYNGLDIMQRDLEETIFGLSRETIYHMSRHVDLSLMVAFDTFVGNFDRTITNLFYDERTDSFCGIDVAIAFRENLCILAIEKIKQFLEDEDLCLSKTELQGLHKFTDALESLVIQYSPEEVCAKMEEYAKQAGFFGDSFFDKDIQQACITYFAHCQQTFKSSYKDTYILISLLNALLAKQ